jgi:hypothetical protein
MRHATHRHRLTAWLVLAGYALVASGLPLPIGVAHGPRSAAAEKRVAGKDRSRAFPCMDKPCGCATAEQCFSNCCCNTPAELLAWAQANRVEPGVIAALGRRLAAAGPDTTAAVSCCASTRQAECCADPVAELPEHCAEPAAVEPVSRHTVVLSAMLACGGIVSQWLAGGAALPPSAVVAVVFVAPLAEPCVGGDDVCRAERAEPAAPPPRLA